MKGRLRFYFITDDGDMAPSFEDQVETAISAGATMIQYRNKRFSPADFTRVHAVRDLCATNRVPFIINDDIILARGVEADGVHLGQTDASPLTAREILGENAIIGLSVSTPDELARTDLSHCNYIGAGPVYATTTKSNAKPVIGLSGLKAVAERSPLPVVAIGGIGPDNAAACFSAGAAGVAAISAITRSADPAAIARKLCQICGCSSRNLQYPWEDEFGLIAELVRGCASAAVEATDWLRVPAGDDAALFSSLRKPVFTTDTQREGVHFRTEWQSLTDVGRKAVEITFSDLAASYARPAGLFVNLTLPHTFTNQEGRQLYAGIDAALKKHRAALGGGNVSSGDRLALDLFAVGEGGDIFPKRSAAKPGDGLYVTGPLGLARAGLHCLKNRDESFPRFVEKFRFPVARFDAAEILAGEGVLCVTDLSDGLVGDAGHVAEASALSIRFAPENFIITPELITYCAKYGLQPAVEIFSGGEDYELLFACPPEAFERIRRRLPGAHLVGGCVPFENRRLINPPAVSSSYRHGGQKLKGDSSR